ncbi:MAG: hypothetical protein J0G96_04820 [Flavobacteriia bacterium]|nr:hypothetical protein [Flavobacteriia bacterium]
MKMKIEEQNLVELNKINWFKLTVREEQQNKEIWLNPHNVQNVIFDWKEKTISIVLNNSDVYEIVCKKEFLIIKCRIEQYLIWNIV